MTDYTLYFSPDSANLVVRMALEEAGVPYRAVLVDRSRRQQRSAEFLALNPQGLLPVLTDGDTVVFETAAILLYLVDRHPSLGPQAGEGGRADLYRWLFYLSNTLHAELRLRFHAGRFVSDPAAAAALRAGLATRLLDHLELLDSHIARVGGSMLETGLSVCDLYLGACCRWMVMYPREDPLPVDTPVRLPALEGLLDSLQRRPAMANACDKEWIEPPYLLNPRMPEPLEGSVLG